MRVKLRTCCVWRKTYRGLSPRRFAHKLTSDESKRFATARRIDPVAQDEFLMGTAERWKATPGGFLKAVDHFKKAIEIQPDYAAAFAGWSNALMQGGFFDRVEEARMTAQKALELDPNLSDAHSAMARKI